MTYLQQGNIAFRNKEYNKSIELYLKAICNNNLSKIIFDNIRFARKKSLLSNKITKKAILSWNIAGNSLGRAYTLAEIYKLNSDVDIIGTIFSEYGNDIWKPLQNSQITIKYFYVKSRELFFINAIDFVLNNAYDFIHISKPKATNIILGALYKLIWGSTIIIDIDDEELSFINNYDFTYNSNNIDFPNINNVLSNEWAQVSIKMTESFDGTTVSNLELQKYYGGIVLHHVRDKNIYEIQRKKKIENKTKYGVALNKKVFLFFGTNRQHKGLFETAQVLNDLKRNDILLVIGGELKDESLKNDILKLKNIDTLFFGFQSFDNKEEFCSIGDFCILYQNPQYAVSTYQIPAKLSDALGTGMIVFATNMPPFKPFFDAKAIIQINNNDIHKIISDTIDDENFCNKQRKKAIDFFEENLTIERAATVLNVYLASINTKRDFNIDFTKFLMHEIIKQAGNILQYQKLSNAVDNIKGDINKNSSISVNCIKGWLANIGDSLPRIATLKIGDSFFEFECKNYRADLDGKINMGNHGFEFIVPIEFLNGKPYTVELIDKKTNKSIKKIELSWIQTRNFSDFSGFLISSLTNPLLNAPFVESDKRCFAIMENIADFLANKGIKLVNKHKWSIIMPVYNRITVVRDAVNSVLNQTYKNIELIIVDDNSTDGSYELLSSIKDKRIVLLRNDSNKNVSFSRNRALRHSTGEFIAYLDSDNIWDVRYIAAAMGAFSECKDAEAIYGGQLLFRGYERHPFAIRFGAYNKALLNNRNFIDLNTFCCRRSVYNKVGYFDESLKRYVDYDLIMRVSDTCIMYSIPVVLSHYFYDKVDNTITNNNDNISHINTVRDKNAHRLKNIFSNKTKENLSKKVSIIIPSYEMFDDTLECVKSILSMSDKNIQIIIVDNNSSKNVVASLIKLQNYYSIKLILNDINYGFTYAVNQGIKAAWSDADIIIMNNDALMMPGAMQEMQKYAYSLPACGLIVPQQILYGGTKTISTHVPYANKDVDCDVNLSSHHNNVLCPKIFCNGNIFELSFAPFFCVYIKRDVLNNSLGLDAQFGRHYRSDRIFCDYIRHVMGLKIYYINSAFVYHKLQKSTDALRNKKRDESFDLIFKKNQWGVELSKKLGYRTALWDF